MNKVPFVFQETSFDNKHLEIFLAKSRSYSYMDSNPVVTRMKIDELRDFITKKLFATVRYMEGIKREAILLSFFFNMAHDEISALFNVTQPTLSFHVRRGIKLLRKHLEQDKSFVDALSRLQELEEEPVFYF